MSIELQVVNKRHNPHVEEFATEHLQPLMDRFESRLNRVVLRVAEEGRNIRCTLNAHLKGMGIVHVSATENNIYAALDKVIERLTTAISKPLDCASHEAIRHRRGREHAVGTEFEEV